MSLCGRQSAVDAPEKQAVCQGLRDSKSTRPSEMPALTECHIADLCVEDGTYSRTNT